MKDFKNKVVIVTGASSGIGEAMAREFAAQGARVVLGARSVQKLQLIAGDIRSRGGQAAYCGVDVTDVGECRRLIDTAVREFGGIDVLVCNAGLSMRAIFDDVDLEVLHRLMDVNFWGTVNCCKFPCRISSSRTVRLSVSRPSPGCTGCRDARAIRPRSSP